jgi:hypothetical protein
MGPAARRYALYRYHRYRTARVFHHPYLRTWAAEEHPKSYEQTQESIERLRLQVLFSIALLTWVRSAASTIPDNWAARIAIRLALLIVLVAICRNKEAGIYSFFLPDCNYYTVLPLFLLAGSREAEIS